jgi:hypothetical protein
MTPTIFSVQLEVKVKSPLDQYANIDNKNATTSYINESAKNTIAEDIEEALRKYGVDATVGLVRKIQQ